MKLIKKLAAGLLLGTGVPLLLLLAVSYFTTPSPSAKDRDGVVAGIILFGLPPVAIGSWLLWSLKQQHQHEVLQLARSQEQLLLDLLNKQQGVVTALQFAAEANMPVVDAKQYLEQKANELDGIVDITEQGGLVYRFPL